MRVIDVTGAGTAGVFLIKGETNLLYEAGMAYGAAEMIDNVKREIGDGKLGAVLLSHSHYDHVAGLPAVRRAWPDVKVCASRIAQEILTKPSALATIRRLSGEAAEAAGLDWDRSYDDRDLRVDEAVEDGQTVRLGDHGVRVFSTVGHTRCSLSYVVDGELMLCSETVGVIGRSGLYMPTFLVDYKEAEASIEKSRRYPVERILLSHYGLLEEEKRAGIWDLLLRMMRDSKETMIRIMNSYDTEEERLKKLEEVYHSRIDRKEQPDEAFDINALSMMRTLRRQFPERFAAPGVKENG